MINKGILSMSLATILSSAIFVGCNGGDDKPDDKKDDLVETPDTIKTTQFNFSGELFSVPSPIQTALLIQKSGVTYDKNILLSSSNVNKFSTDYSRSLNLGIYGADLGYVSLYNQTQDALSYLGAVKQLADKLGISAAFDASTMERIQKNVTNKDSMMVLVGIAYRSSDAYLKNNQRSDVSSLVLAGGWIESLYFSVNAFKSKPNEEIKRRIAEQKQTLTSLIKILGMNTGNADVVELTKQLTDLSKVYEGVILKYNFVEPTTDTVKKVTYINSTSDVTITDEQLTQISTKIVEIRNNITNVTKS
ncbi:MAG: hypothetical protein LCH32_04210 [Bacteroidetes bacterium]|nr:hypothetical protein [Bacteroidota bacterium]